jgi:hypothetical protein
MRALPAAAVGPRPRSTRCSLSLGRQRDLTGLPAHARAGSLDLGHSAARQAERREWPEPRVIHRSRSQPGRSQQGAGRTRGDEREELAQHTGHGMERIYEDSEDNMTRIANEGGGDPWQQTSAEMKDVLAADLINRMMTQVEEETQWESSGDNMGAATARRAISRVHPPGALAVKEDEPSGDEGRGFVRRQVLRMDTPAPSGRGARRHVRSASAISMGRSERYREAGGLPHGSPGRDGAAPPRALLKSRPPGRRVGGSLGSEAEWQHELASLLSRHPARGKKQGPRAAGREAPEDEWRARSRSRAVSPGSIPEKEQGEGAAPLSRAQQLQALVAAQREDTAHVLASAYSPTRRPSPLRSPAARMAKSTSLRPPTEEPAADQHSQVGTSHMRTPHSLGLPQWQRPAGGSSPDQMQRRGGLGGPARQAQSGPAQAPDGPPEEMVSSSSGSTASQEAAADGAQSEKRREAGKVEFLLKERVTEFNAVQARRHRRSGSMVSLDLEGKPPRGTGDDHTLGFGRFTEEDTEVESEMAKEEGKGGGAVEELVKQPTGELWRWMSTDQTVEFAPLPPNKAAAASSAAPPDVSPDPPVPDAAEGHLDPGVLYVLLHSHVPEACVLQERVRAICEEEGVALLWTPKQDGDPGAREAASDSPRSADRSGSPLRSPWPLDDRPLGARSPRLVEKGRALSPLPSRAPPPRAMSYPTLTGPRAAIAAAEGRIAAVFAGLASTSVRFAAPFVWYLEEGSGGRERVEMLRHKHGVEFTAALPSGSLTLWLATPAVHRKVLAYLRELAGAMGGPAQLAQIQEEPPGEDGQEAGERRLPENQADTMQAG